MKKKVYCFFIIIFSAAIFFLSCKKEKSCEGCRENNKPPIAIAGPDQVITLPTDSLSLDGSASNDPDGTISEWLWKKIAGPASFDIVSRVTANTIVRSLDSGVYQFELFVRDDGGLDAKDTMQVTVMTNAPTNRPPVANAGNDTTITVPANATLLNGSLSADPDNNITSFFWTKISGPLSFSIANPNSVQTQVVNLVQGVYQFELKVTDAVGLFSKDTMQVTINSVTPTNRPPIANAGSDTTIILPANVIDLDGSRSTDPDNNTTNYFWTKISGPSSFSIANANAVQTQVNNLAEGVYQFELKVTDAEGLFDKDTMQLTVNVSPPPLPTVTCEPLNRPVINAQLVPIGNLSIGRYNMATAATSTKIFFAGGSSGTGGLSSRVDIYDITGQTWSVAELSIPRWFLSAIGAGDKVFFAGGYSVGATSRVDIYNLTTQSWSTAELSQARAYIKTATIGNKVFFAGGSNGGNYSSRVDIYDISANTWSTANLSEAKIGFTATVVDNKIYFAGGDTSNSGPTSTVIDIYDAATDSWSKSTLNIPKAFHAAIFKNGKIYWAGGATHINYQGGIGNEDLITCQVEIRDANTQVSSFTNLSYPKYFTEVFEKNNRLLFLSLYSGWGHWQDFDIYDVTSGNWLVGQLLQSTSGSSYASMISVNNTIYVAGGIAPNNVLSNQVWKLEF